MLLLLLAVVKASEDAVCIIYDAQDKNYVSLEGPKTNLDLTNPCSDGYSVAQVIHWKNYELSTRMDEVFADDGPARKIFCPAVQYSNSAWTFGTAAGHTVAEDDQQEGLGWKNANNTFNFNVIIPFKGITQVWGSGEATNGKQDGAYLEYDADSDDYKMYSFTNAEKATLELYVLCKGKNLDWLINV